MVMVPPVSGRDLFNSERLGENSVTGLLIVVDLTVCNSLDSIYMQSLLQNINKP